MRKIESIGPGEWSDARLLAHQIHLISERLYYAGWLDGIEFQLWDALQAQDKTQTMWSELTGDEIAELMRLKDKVQGWVVWRDDSSDPGLDILDWGEYLVTEEEMWARYEELGVTEVQAGRTES